MQITITLPDELVPQVIETGLTPESYVEALIAAQISSREALPVQKRLSREELNASLDRLAQFSDKMPVLSDAQISRESMYEDHN